MPRDGLQQYAPPPGTDGIPNYTVESARYNAFTHDITADQNNPRPIVAGGTGASDARTAMINLSGEIANQVVTNYDSYPFVAGSFTSIAGATSAPTAGNAYAGICYVYSSPDFITLEARQQVGGAGILYVRQKMAGVWGAWVQQAGSVADLDAAYVNISGDIMSGPLTINGGAFVGNGGWPFVAHLATNLNFAALNNGGAAYVGSFTDAGANAPLQISSSTINLTTGYTTTQGAIYITNTSASSSPTTGALTVAGGVGIGGVLSTGSTASIFSHLHVGGDVFVGDGTAQGVVRFGIGGQYLWWNSSQYILNGGKLNINDATASSSPTTGALTVAGGVGLGGDLHAGFNIYAGENQTDASINFGNTGGKLLIYQNASGRFTLQGGNLLVPGISTSSAAVNIGSSALSAYNAIVKVGYSGGSTQYGMVFRPAADNTNPIMFSNAADANVGAIVTTPSATSYVTTSDANLKDDLKSFDAGNIVDETNVYDFKWKSTGERAYGVIAQQAVDVYPTAVVHNEKNEAGDEFWGVDYSKYVPVLLQELKALRARVAQLEGRIEAKPA